MLLRNWLYSVKAGDDSGGGSGASGDGGKAKAIAGLAGLFAVLQFLVEGETHG